MDREPVPRADLIVVSAVEFDMNKHFQMMWVAVAIAAGWLIRRWPRPIVAAVVAFAALSPTLIGIWTVASRTVAMSDAQARAAEWIASSTPQGSVFVMDTWTNSPVDVAGRLAADVVRPVRLEPRLQPRRAGRRRATAPV